MTAAEGAGDVDVPDDGDDGQDGPKKSQATELVELALDAYALGVTEAGEAYAVAKSGPNVALQFRGGRSSLGAALARMYFDTRGKAPTAAARADALTVLEGIAADLDPVEPALRVGRDERGRIVVDLASADGWAVRLNRGSYEVLEASPVLFRRTNLTLPMPCPSDGCGAQDLSSLRDCGMNMEDGAWRLLVGYLVASLIPDIPHPVLALFGEQGTGKSTAGRLIGLLVDPSSAPLRTSPRNEESWAVQAAGSWVVVLDNVSSVQPWLSDALCRAVTGDGYVRRQLYTASDLSVLQFRRVVAMTSIDAGALRGDLAERLLPIELQCIPSTERRTEATILEQFERLHPRILGGLFGLTAQVLDVLPGIELTDMPRLADFARILAALDKVTGWATLDAFRGVGTELAIEVVDADPIASAIVAHVTTHGAWSGTASALCTLLSTEERERLKDWPKSPRAMAGAVKRASTAMRSVGVDATEGARTNSGRLWHLTTCEDPRDRPSQRTQPSPAPPLQATPSAQRSDGVLNEPGPSHQPSLSDPCNDADRDGSDGSDGLLQHSSHIDPADLCIACEERPAGLTTRGYCFPCFKDFGLIDDEIRDLADAVTLDLGADP